MKVVFQSVLITVVSSLPDTQQVFNIGLAQKFTWIVHKLLWKNQNELFGHPSTFFFLHEGMSELPSFYFVEVEV